jgi:hypothetical protein
MKKTLVSTAVAALLATSGFAALNPAESTNGTGQMLIAPAFYGSGNFSTYLKVVNTNVTESVFVRVVVRDVAHSMEVDFPILLSPGDVWDATISQNANGKTVLTSTDDSTHPDLASQLNAGVVLEDINTRAAGKFKSGYVEFLPIAQFDEGSAKKVEKTTTLKNRFTALSNSTLNGVDGSENANRAWVSKVVDNNSVAGFVSIINGSTTNPNAMTLPMLALENVNSKVMRGTPMQLGQDTVMGEYLREDLNGVETNYEREVMDLLKSTTFAVPYRNGGQNSMINMTYWNDLATTHNQERRFDYFVYDMSENKNQVQSAQFSGQVTQTYSGSTVNELGQRSVADLISAAGASFTDGWIYASNFRNVYNSASLNGTGNVANAAPTAIATLMEAIKVGDKFSTNWMYIPTR